MRKTIFETLDSIMRSWGQFDRRPGRSPKKLLVYLPEAGTRVLVGNLSVQGDGEDAEFVFRYSADYRKRGLPPIKDFPELAGEFRSDRLPTFFMARIPPLDRDDVRTLLAERKVATTDLIGVLGHVARRDVASPFELEFAEPNAA